MELLFFAIFFLSVSTVAAAEKKVDFNRDIRPLIFNSCIACHGPDEKKRKAKLRLDTVDGAIRELRLSIAPPPIPVPASSQTKGLKN